MSCHMYKPSTLVSPGPHIAVFIIKCLKVKAIKWWDRQDLLKMIYGTTYMLISVGLYLTLKYGLMIFHTKFDVALKLTFCIIYLNCAYAVHVNSRFKIQIFYSPYITYTNNDKFTDKDNL